MEVEPILPLSSPISFDPNPAIKRFDIKILYQIHQFEAIPYPYFHPNKKFIAIIRSHVFSFFRNRGSLRF
jgi:hypothetical protein